MIQRSIVYIIVVITIFLVACSRRPNYVVSEKKMVDVLYDIQLAQAVFRNNYEFASDNKKDAIVEGILKKHNITQAELDSSLLWYSDNIQIYLAINDSVASRLRANSDRMVALQNELFTKARDWSNYIIPPFHYLTESSPTVAFTIDSFKVRTIDLDAFSIVFDVQGVNSTQEIEAGIYYTYTDTLVKYISPIGKNGHYVLDKPQLADSLLRGISGYIHMKNKIKGSLSGVLLYNMSYLDSLRSDMEQTILSIEEPDKSEVVLIPTDKKILSKPEQEINERKESDDVPVISKDEIERSSIMKRNRNNSKLKKSE